jgi:endonuclease/exonuclease/phosphatase family metal-dependent hydrolase
MEIMNLKVVSWNIAGGHPMASLDHLDYGPEDLDYFVEEIRKFEPDILCLQEAHTPLSGGASNAEQIAKALGMLCVLNEPANISHIDTEYDIGVALISKIPFKNSKTTFLPNPHIESVWEDGRLAYTHEKNLQVVDFEDFSVANNQMLPITLFGHKYDDESRGGELAGEINAVMTDFIPSAPLIWCGDFNFSDPLKVYPYMQERELVDALPDEGTRPAKDGSKKRPDHIFYTSEFKVVQTIVKKTNTDHYLCFAEFSRE